MPTDTAAAPFWSASHFPCLISASREKARLRLQLAGEGKWGIAKAPIGAAIAALLDLRLPPHIPMEWATDQEAMRHIPSTAGPELQELH